MTESAPRPFWTPDDIPWSSFNASLVDPDLLRIAKAAALTESNGGLYSRYLKTVFEGDTALHAELDRWAREEEQHGEVLGRWAEMADPTFDYISTLQAFRDGYQIPTDGDGSVRGSRSGEMVARCIVEAGTSSLYSALRDQAEEPVLKAICHRVAGDEFRHYKLFRVTLDRFLEQERISTLRRLMVALSRISETEDDELAFAYHCANSSDRPYDRAWAYEEYALRAFRSYRRHHVQRCAHMVLKAAGLPAQGIVGTITGKLMWRYVKRKIDFAETRLARRATLSGAGAADPVADDRAAA